MNIYIEDFLFQNILINLCLLKLIEITTKSKTTLIKSLTSSIIGAGISAISATLVNQLFIMNCLKIFNACLMIFMCFKSNIKQFIYNVILLFIFTYSFKGIISSFSARQYYTNWGTITLSTINLNYVCIFILGLTYVFQFVLKHIKFKIQTNNLIYKVKLFTNKNSITVNAYLDTGNLLNINGKPIIIVDINSYLKLTKSNLIDFYIAKTEVVNTSTVTGKSNLKIFKLNKVEIFQNQTTQTLENQYIAVNTNSFKNNNYQAILSPMFF